MSSNFTDSIGVSAIVALRRDLSPEPHGRRAGSVGIVVGQASNGPNRYRVIFPGEPFIYSLPARDLEVLQGVALEGWWRPGFVG